MFHCHVVLVSFKLEQFSGLCLSHRYLGECRYLGEVPYLDSDYFSQLDSY